MFRGQRGAQATENFFDVSNTLERFAFFGDLLNEYVFGKLLIWFLLLLAVLAVTVRALAGRRKQAQTAGMQDSTLQAESCSDVPQEKQASVTGAAFWLLAFAAAGYFLTVSKTALLLGATSNRYQLPVYGIIVLILFVGVYELGRRCVFRGSKSVVAGGVAAACHMTHVSESSADSHHISRFMWAAAVVLLLVVDIVSLAGGKVVFLYPEDKEQVAFAREKAGEDVPVVYFYDAGADWCIWDVTDELLEYPQVYFAAAGGGTMGDESSSASGQLVDERIGNASELVVYVADGADAAAEIGRITVQYPQFAEWEPMFEEKYCQVYLVKAAE
jgi:predicted secreted protein